MAKRNTEYQYKELATKFNGVFIGPLPDSVGKLTEWQCSQGHLFSLSSGKIKSKLKNGSVVCHFCPEGRTSKFLTIKDFNKIAILNDGKYLGKTKTKLMDMVLWECKNGHQFQQRYNNIRESGTWCNICENNNKIIECLNFGLSQFNIKCLSGEYKNNASKLIWQCLKCNNIFSISYKDLKCLKKEACFKCISLGWKHPKIFDYWIEEFSPYDISAGSKKKIKLLCPNCNEKFETQPNRWKKAQSCTYCEGKKIGKSNNVAAIFPHIYDELSDKNETDPKTITCGITHKRFILKCDKNNHDYSLNVRAWCRGVRCPICYIANEGKTFIYLTELFPNITIHPHFKITPPKNFQCPYKDYLYVDFYFEYNGNKIIVEYNGRQHYEVVKYGKIPGAMAQLIFAKQAARDIWVRQYCIINNIIFIEIDGRKYRLLKIKKYLEEQISKLCL